MHGTNVKKTNFHFLKKILEKGTQEYRITFRIYAHNRTKITAYEGCQISNIPMCHK